MPSLIVSPSWPKATDNDSNRRRRGDDGASSSVRGLESVLTVSVALLAACTVSLQLYVENVYAHDVVLGTSDEARLAAQISDIEVCERGSRTWK